LKVSLKGYQFGFADKTHGKKNATAANQFLKNQIHYAGKNEDITVSVQEVTIFKGITFNYRRLGSVVDVATACGIRSLDRPARGRLLYRRRYPAH